MDDPDPGKTPQERRHQNKYGNTKSGQLLLVYKWGGATGHPSPTYKPLRLKALHLVFAHVTIATNIIIDGSFSLSSCTYGEQHTVEWGKGWKTIYAYTHPGREASIYISHSPRNAIARTFLSPLSIKFFGEK